MGSFRETREWLNHVYHEGLLLYRAVSLDGSDSALEFVSWLQSLRRHVGERRRAERVSGAYRRYSRGDVVWVDFGWSVGTELRGIHPAIVASWCDTRGRSIVTVIPLTSRPAKPQYAEVDLGHLFGSDKASAALVLQIRTVSKLRIGQYMGHISEADFAAVNHEILRTLANSAVIAANAQVAATSPTALSRRSGFSPDPAKSES